MSVICFHGVITESLLNGGGPKDAGQVPGRGFTHHWMHISVNVFMRVGTPCTYICSDDVDHMASIHAGKIVYQMRLHAVPGHLEGTISAKEAIDTIVKKHFRDVEKETTWLTKLTQEGRVIVLDSNTNKEKICTCNCPIDILMSRGCICGSV